MSPVEGRQVRVSSNPGTASYGAIVVTAAIAAAASHDDRPWAVLVKVGATLVVFWLAHVHSALIEERFKNPDEPTGLAIRNAVLHELVMLEIAAAPIAFLVAGTLGLVRVELALGLALWSGVAELFAIGIVRARRSAHGLPGTLALGALYAASGGALVALKVAVH